MGITIDESMEVLQEIPKVMPITKEAINVALDTMRKYQKIEEVVADFNNQYNHRTALDLICEVKEVVENGNDK